MSTSVGRRRKRAAPTPNPAPAPARIVDFNVAPRAVMFTASLPIAVCRAAAMAAEADRIPDPPLTTAAPVDVAEAVAPNCKHEIVGIRPGEKLHEEMITSSDSPSTIDLGNYYAILGTGLQNKMSKYLQVLKAKPVPAGFAYESGTNPDFLSVGKIRSLIKLHMNQKFEPF